MPDISRGLWCVRGLKDGAAARLSAAVDRARVTETKSTPLGLLDVVAASTKALLAAPVGRRRHRGGVLGVGVLADARRGPGHFGWRADAYGNE